MPTWLGGAWCTLATACATASPQGEPHAAIDNPTGDCAAPDSGARQGYHQPDDGDVWLRDCELNLNRELWRVFAQSPSRAYVVPRPDGAAALRPVCAGDDAAGVRPTLDRYTLCSASPDITLVNAMDPADALAITHYLHSQLRFEATVDQTGITPFALKCDVRDACELEPNQSSELETVCMEVRDSLASGTDIGIDYSGPAAMELAALLNELYGIPPTG
jgi:hypothetical protein